MRPDWWRAGRIIGAVLIELLLVAGAGLLSGLSCTHGSGCRHLSNIVALPVVVGSLALVAAGAYVDGHAADHRQRVVFVLYGAGLVVATGLLVATAVYV